MLAKFLQLSGWLLGSGLARLLPSRVRMQVRSIAVTAAPRLTARSGDGPQLQERWFPAASQVQTVMDSVLVLLRDRALPSEITTGRK